MRQATLDEIGKLAADARDALYAAARSKNLDAPKLILHWTAGWYGNLYGDYHISIAKDGATMIATDNFAEVLSHTWRRNTGSIGIALCCCAFADTESLGDAPPTKAQIETMAQVIAKLADALWLTIDKKHVLTHGEAADSEDGVYTYTENDCYGPKNDCERWDLEYLETDESPTFNPYATDGSRGGDVLRGKANWYRQKWIEEAKRYGGKE